MTTPTTPPYGPSAAPTLMSVPREAGTNNITDASLWGGV